MNRVDRKQLKRQQKQLEHNPLLFARVAEQHLALHQIRPAFQLCLKGVNAHPDYLPGQWLLSRCLLQQKREHDALRLVTAILERAGSDRHGKELLANLLESNGEASNAIPIWLDLYRIDPFDRTIERKLTIAITNHLQREFPIEAHSLIPLLSDGYVLCAAAEALSKNENPVEAIRRVEAWQSSILEPIITTPVPDSSVTVEEAVAIDTSEATAEVLESSQPITDEIEALPIVEFPSEFIDIDALPTPDEISTIVDENQSLASKINEELLKELPTVEPDPVIERPRQSQRKRSRPMVTKTIAELYAQQGEYEQAAEVYRELVALHPDRSDWQDRMIELTALANEQPERRKDDEPD